MSRHVVAAFGEIGPGECKIVSVKGREIGVFNIGGEYFALLNRCPHAGAELCRGRLLSLAEADEPGKFRLSRRGEILRCPWHGWEFDVRTGQSWCDPQTTRVRSYAVTVEPGERLVKGPYVVETFAVTIDNRYLVIDV